LRACECWNLKRWAAVGAVTGIAILTRGNINFFLPGLLAALLYFGIMLLLASLVINLAGPGFVQYAMSISGY